MDFSSSKIVLDGKHKQLIDLNKEHALFDAEFTITPHTLDFEKKYEIAVVSQSVLDNDEISFKEVSGIYQGNAKHDDPESNYENFFLVIRSSQKIRELNVDVSIKPIAKPAVPKQEVVVREEESLDNKIEKFYHETDFWSKNRIKIIIAFFVIVAGCFLMYYFWKRQKSAESVPTLPALQKINATLPPANNISTTDKLFNPFKLRRSPPSIASSNFSKSPGSDSGRSFVFEE